MSRSHLPYSRIGATGDYAGARRGQRAFRLSVVAIIMSAAALWFAENYLRYDLGESQYLAALSLNEESARPLLRNVVKRDTEQNEVPSVRYVEALAEIEEPGLELQRFEQAYKLDRKNSILIVKYGCQLFANKQYREARERFREAGVQPPKNALPRYLEAAALAATTRPEDSLADTIALLARTNNTLDPVIFPKPLWHESLPKNSALYAEKRRTQVDRVLAPLYHFSNILIERAERALEEGVYQDWDSWLEQFQAMGARLVSTAEAEEENIGVSQSLAGIHFQQEALRLRNEIRRLQYGVELDGYREYMVGLQTARETLIGAEARRNAQVQAAETTLTKPLGLVWRLLALCFAALVVSAVLYRFSDHDRVLWTVPQPRAMYLFLGLGLPALLSNLLLFQLLAPEPGSTAFLVTQAGWWGIGGLLILAGWVYPPLYIAGRKGTSIKSAPEHSETTDPSDESESQSADDETESYLAASLALSRRYFGLLLGLYIMAVCVWFIGFRLMKDVYPVQLHFLTPGFLDQELEAVRQVQQMLQGIGA